jgi:hypothetical protein
VGFSVRVARRAGHSLRDHLRWFDVPIAGLALGGILGLIVAWDKTSAWRAFSWLFAGGLIYLWVSRLCEASAPRRLVARLLMLSGAVVASYVVLQYRYLGYEVKHAYLDAAGRALSAFVPRVGTWTPFSNTVATFLEGILPLTVALVLAPGQRAWRLASVASGAVMLVALLLVASRGAWVAVAAASLIGALLAVVRRRGIPVPRLTAPGVATLVVALLATTVAIAGASLPANDLLAAFNRPDRIDVYRNSLILIGDFPFTGIGPGDQFGMALARYALLIQVPFLTYSHNLLLDVWLELGLIGILSFVALVGSVGGAVVAGERTRSSTRFRATWVGVVAILIHGLTDARQSIDGWTWLPLFVLLGLLAARIKRAGVRRTIWTMAPPIVTTAIFIVVALPYVMPLSATWEANLGTLAQAHAELGAHGESDRAHLMTEARQHYSEAIRLDSHQTTALRRLGALAVDEHRFDDARVALEAAWTQDADNAATRKALGLAHTWTGDLHSAQSLLTPVTGIVGELNVWSWWWENQGQMVQAVNAARVSLLMQPDQPDMMERLERLENHRQSF